MNFLQATKYLIKHARYSHTECGISSTTLEEASKIVEQFVKYLPNDFTNDKLPNMKHKPYTDFCDDKEKMVDFEKLSKDDFLSSYSYINETEYNLTRFKCRKKNVDTSTDLCHSG